MSLNLRVEAEMVAESFSSVLQNFVRQIGELQRLSLLRGADGNNEVLKRELQEFSLKITKLEDCCSELESYIQEEKGVVDEALNMISLLKEQHRRAQHIRLQLVSVELPLEKTEEQLNKDGDIPDLPNKENLDSTNNLEEIGVERGAAGKCDSGDTGDDVNNGSTSESNSSELKLLKAPDQESLEGVPRYMRSRLTHQQLLEVVNTINDALTNKYKIMRMPRSKQGTTARQQFEKWRKQETVETQEEGLVFVSNEDILDTGKDNGVDFNILKTSLQVLRYCGGLRLHGEGGIHRFIVV
uniref:Spindle and kinetochore-associated protein 1 n=1 Tax=Aplanochytrium stocchinoi TaxID=215587 RepID=A0A7S3PF98_9STRA